MLLPYAWCYTQYHLSSPVYSYLIIWNYPSNHLRSFFGPSIYRYCARSLATIYFICPLVKISLDEPYRAVKLGQISSLIKRNDPRSNAPIMMLSAGNGFIMQSDKYSRDNAGQSLKKIYSSEKRSWANHGHSKAKQFGCCYRLLEEEAREATVCLPLVSKFKDTTDHTMSLWVKQYKDGSLVKTLVSSNVRMDGLL